MAVLCCAPEAVELILPKIIFANQELGNVNVQSMHFLRELCTFSREVKALPSDYL